MAKYIDAERLKAEIKRQKHELELSIQSQGDYGQSCHIVAYDNILSLINSLQQEQPKKSKKDCNGCPHCVDRKDQYGWHFKGCFAGPYKGKFIAEIDECPLKQEQPEVDLEKELDKYLRGEFKQTAGGNFNNYIQVARHFYELGKNSK